MKKIESCIYYCAKEQIEWKLEYKRDKALITKSITKTKSFFPHIEKKQLDKEVMSNLDIFFDAYCFEKWQQLPFKENKNNNSKDTIIIVSDNQTFQLSSTQILPEDEKNIFRDLYRYFTMYWEEIVKPITLSYHSFDGGGPDFSMQIKEKGIFTWYSLRNYYNEDHEKLSGAGYTITYTLYPLRTGKSSAILTAFSPICPQSTREIFVKVDENFCMTYHVEETKMFNKR